jgi:antitoxin component of MazEF toxin-antitoxin module
MKAKIQQSGDDLIVMIPEALVDQLDLHDGDEIELLIKKPKYRLEDLLEGMDENNINRGWDDDFPVHA